jgi:hypothetical protein
MAKLEKIDLLLGALSRKTGWDLLSRRDQVIANLGQAEREEVLRSVRGLHRGLKKASRTLVDSKTHAMVVATHDLASGNSIGMQLTQLAEQITILLPAIQKASNLEGKFESEADSSVRPMTIMYAIWEVLTDDEKASMPFPQFASVAKSDVYLWYDEMSPTGH